MNEDHLWTIWCYGIFCLLLGGLVAVIVRSMIPFAVASIFYYASVVAMGVDLILERNK